MAQFKNVYKVELNQGTAPVFSLRQIYYGDVEANRIGAIVLLNGEPVALSGTCSGTAILADGSTVAITGTVDGSQAYVELPAACYSVEGQIEVYVKLTVDGVTTTLIAGVGTVRLTETDTVIDPGTIIPSVAALISDIDDAVASIPADYSALLATIAPTFSTSTAYAAGTYAWYSGTLYRFTVDHAAGSWTGSDAVAVVVGAELSTLKSALPSIASNAIDSTLPNETLNWVENVYIRMSDNAVISDNDFRMSAYIKVNTGETLYCYGALGSGKYFVCAYDASFNFVPSASYGASSGTVYAYTYVVPVGVRYIRLCVTKANTAVSEVITTQYYHYEQSVFDDLFVSGDLSGLRFVTAAYYEGTTKTLRMGSNQKQITLYGFIPADDIYKISISNTTDYTMVIQYFDSTYTYKSQKTASDVFGFAFPSGTKYILLVFTKSAGTAAIGEVGLKILSKKCFAHKEAIESFELERPENWNCVKFIDDFCVSDPTTEKMAHTSNIYDGNDGYFYIPYFGNHSAAVESISENIISKIAKVSQCNPRDVTIVPIAEKGQDFVNFVQSSLYAPYDALLMNKGDSKYSVCFVATPTTTNEPTIAVREFTKATMTAASAATLSTFKYTINGTTYTVPMNISNLDTFINRLLGDDGNTHTIGTYPIITRAIPYNNEYYSYLGGLQTTSATTGFGGCIIKTADKGETWEFVAYNPALTAFITAMWEGAIDINASGKVFCLLRAWFKDAEIGTSIYLADIAMSYDIANDTWSEPIRMNGSKGATKYDSYLLNTGNYDTINTDSSRPFVYLKDGYVYLMCNVTPRLKTTWKPSGVVRSTLRIYKCDSNLEVLAKKSLQSDSGVSYFSCLNARGREWFCFTEDRKHLQNDCKGNISIIPMIDFLP